MLKAIPNSISHTRASRHENHDTHLLLLGAHINYKHVYPPCTWSSLNWSPPLISPYQYTSTSMCIRHVHLLIFELVSNPNRSYQYKITSNVEYVHPPCTWSSLNWSPPKADTHGLIPPVPRAMITKPTAASALEEKNDC